jgi:thiol-disulfide isomerase/thioredoxin
VRTVPFLVCLSVALASPALAAKPTLKQRVEALEQRLDALDQGKAPANRPNPDDAAAMVMYREADAKAREGDVDAARKVLEELLQRFPSSSVVAAASRMQDQLAVVGKPIADLRGVDWLQGSYRLGDDRAALLVFWEVWCPHCQREVPKLEDVYTRFHGDGLGVVALTKLSRGKAAGDALAFAKEHGVTYPIGHEDGALSDFFDVSGVPAAAVVVDGKVVWRGHPAQITDAMIQGWLKK